MAKTQMHWNIGCLAVIIHLLSSCLGLRGKGTPNQKLACFVHCLKIIKIFGKNNISILKQIVWETQKWHYNFSRPSSCRVIDQNNILNVLSYNPRTAEASKILMTFLSSSDNLLQDNHIFFFKKILIILR